MPVIPPLQVRVCPSSSLAKLMIVSKFLPNEGASPYARKLRLPVSWFWFSLHSIHWSVLSVGEKRSHLSVVTLDVLTGAYITLPLGGWITLADRMAGKL